MGYIDDNLMNNEEIKYNAKIHWFIYIPSLLWFLLAIGLLAPSLATLLASSISWNPDGVTTIPIYLLSNSDILLTLLSPIAALFSVVSFIKSFIIRSTTELAITSKRVIAKFGFISRKSIELNHSKVESLSVNQSVIGRVFGFGTLIINGTGGGKTPIRGIDNPLKFRRNAMEIVDNVQG